MEEPGAIRFLYLRELHIRDGSNVSHASGPVPLPGRRSGDERFVRTTPQSSPPLLHLHFFFLFLHAHSSLPPSFFPPLSSPPSPCPSHVLAKTMAAVTPMKPKKGAEAGHFST